MLEKAEFPDLRIVRVDELVVHENVHRERGGELSELLRAEGVLKSPPVVASLGRDDPRYVVLDGATRTVALTTLRVPYALVQVVNYESDRVQISTWSHLITDISRDQLTGILARLNGLDFAPCDLHDARAALVRREVVAYLAFDSNSISVAEGGSDLTSRLELLNKMVDSYKDKCRIHRTIDDHMDGRAENFEHAAALIVYPRYQPKEIMTLVRNGMSLPAGITRHIIQGRAIKVNYPLSELSLKLSPSEMNHRLKIWIENRLKERQVRFYDEATYIFDE